MMHKYTYLCRCSHLIKGSILILNIVRYLVFVDDVKRVTPWKDISNAFRENVMDSRIIVTTIVPSVARARSCGRPGSYMYTVKGLDKENSRRLFRAKFWQDDGYSAEGEVDLHANDVDIINIY